MPRFAHTMIRVENLETSKAFYTDVLGMRIFKDKEYPSGKFTLVFLGYEASGAMVELTYNWDTKKYAIGEGFGHLAIEVDDIYAFCDEAKAKGACVVREPGPYEAWGLGYCFFRGS